MTINNNFQATVPVIQQNNIDTSKTVDRYHNSSNGIKQHKNEQSAHQDKHIVNKKMDTNGHGSQQTNINTLTLMSDDRNDVCSNNYRHITKNDNTCNIISETLKEFKHNKIQSVKTT